MDELVAHLADEAATVAFGTLLARLLPDAAVIYLSGDLGAGKTTLCRGLLHAWGHRGAVKSPTYTLVEPYELPGRRVYHCDLYRLGAAEELEFIGLRDWLAEPAILLVEWAAHGAGHLPAADLELRLAYAGDGRAITMHAASALGREIVDRLHPLLARA